MYHVIGTVEQMEELSASIKDCLPIQIWERLKKKIKSLEQCYGADRDLEANLGGYAVIFSSMSQEEHRKILEKYHAQEEAYEYRDIISTEGGQKWVEELYILSSDYGIVMFYPIMAEKGGLCSD